MAVLIVSISVFGSLGLSAEVFANNTQLKSIVLDSDSASTDAIPNQILDSSEHPLKLSSSVKRSNAGARNNADLAFDYVQASWSSSDAGDSETISVRIENIGSASSGSFRWGLYLSSDTTITTSDTHIDDWSESSLSSGSSRYRSKSITIPTSISGGYYYVGGIVDINSQVSESDENNNDDYDSGRVHIYEQPDLIGRSCSATTSGTVGDQIGSSISIQLENDVSSSHGASSGTFYWAMYLSTDSTITSSDTQVGSDQYASSLNGGSYRSDSLSSSTYIPSSMNAGTYYWGFIVDVDADVDEADENNNGYTCNQMTLLEDLPDLEATSVGTSSSSVVMGDTITVSYRIDNIGTDYSGSFYWKLYLSTDTTITTSDTLVDEFSVSSISGGSYRSGYEYSVQIPTGMASGYHYLGMIADNRAGVNELDETNNKVADTGRIDIEEMADLVPSTASGPTSGQAGQQVSFSWRIDNDGDDTAGWFYWKLYLSSDSTITTSDTQVGSTQQANSISGGSYRSSTSFSVTIPNTLSSGTYYWGLIADTTDRVSEGDETNNILRGNSISITVPDYDLSATSISVDASSRSVCVGDDIYLTLSVTNLGSDYAGSHYYEATVATGSSDLAILYGTSLGYAPGQSGVASYTHTSIQAALPSSLGAGTYWVGLIADTFDDISESDESNNIVATSSAQLTILDCQPDLSAISISGTSSGVRGGTVQVDVQVDNIGRREAQGVGVDVYLSTDSAIDSSDVYIGSDTISSLAEAGTWTNQLSLSIPSDLGDGCWTWGLIVDLAGGIVEMDESNNIIASSGQFCLQQADLIVTSVSAVSDTASGQSVEVTIVVTNSGGSAAGASVGSLLLSVDASESSGDSQIESFSIPNLAAGASDNIVVMVTIPSGHVGDFYWIVVLDTAATVVEDDESNNAGASAKFNIAAPSKDLLATWIEGPSSAEPGQTITLEWGIENLGQQGMGFAAEIWLSADPILGNQDIRLSRFDVPELAPSSRSDDLRTVSLGGDTEGTWWLILKVDADNQHIEDDELNNVRVSNSTIIIDANAGPISGEFLPGCDDPTTDGDEADAAATRSSALHLGLDPNQTVDGCLSGFDEVDWYAFLLSSGNRTTFAFSAEGAHLEVIAMNGSETLAEGAVDDDVDWLTMAALNDDTEGAHRVIHLRVTWDPANPSGAYRILLVTADASVETDVAPPAAPEITLPEGWTGAKEIVLTWTNGSDSGSGVGHHEVRWAGGFWAPVDADSITLNLSGLADGRHSFEVRAVDRAGNIGPADAIWIRIDRLAPLASVTQVDAQYANPALLIIEVIVDDGEGSGPTLIEWSSDNSTWSELAENGVMNWTSWDDLDLFIRVTDGAENKVTTNLTIIPPPAETTAEDGTQKANTEGAAGRVSPWLALPIILVISVAAVLAVLLRRRIHELAVANDAEFDSEPSVGIDSTINYNPNIEGEAAIDFGGINQTSEMVAMDAGMAVVPALQYDSVTGSVPQIVPLLTPETPITPVQLPSSGRVPDHTMLPSGGEYDTSSGSVAYVTADGVYWWQQVDGSFLRQEPI
jgi:subtilase family serine protease